MALRIGRVQRVTVAPSRVVKRVVGPPKPARPMLAKDSKLCKHGCPGVVVGTLWRHHWACRYWSDHVAAVPF